MNIFINHAAEEVDQAITLATLLKLKAIDSRTVAVAVNYTIVTSSLWPEVVLNENDEIDIFSVVAGG